MNLTKKMVVKLHRELWEWIYAETLKTRSFVFKEQWHGWAHNGGKYRKYDINSECFPCEYALNQMVKHSVNKDDLPVTRRCRYCPLDWEITNNCLVANSYYSKWCWDGYPM